MQGDDGGVFRVDPEATNAVLDQLARTKADRDEADAQAALDALRDAAREGTNMVEPSIACALARVTTGEWADALREVFGEYRPVTGIEGQQLSLEDDRVIALRSRVDALASSLGHRPRLVVGKPGLDGHSNGAEMIAVAARHVGFDVVYSGIRLTPAQIVQSAVEEDVDLIGLSVLSGSHLELVEQTLAALAGADASDIPVVLGGIIPAADVPRLTELGIRATFTPADYSLTDILERIVEVIEA